MPPVNTYGSSRSSARKACPLLSMVTLPSGRGSGRRRSRFGGPAVHARGPLAVALRARRAAVTMAAAARPALVDVLDDVATPAVLAHVVPPGDGCDRLSPL